MKSQNFEEEINSVRNNNDVLTQKLEDQRIENARRFSIKIK